MEFSIHEDRATIP